MVSLDLLVISAAVIGLIGSSIGFPFALISLWGDWIILVGGAGAAVASGASLLAAILVMVLALGITLPITL